MIDYLTALVEGEAVLELERAAWGTSERRREVSGDVDRAVLAGMESDLALDGARESLDGLETAERLREAAWLEEAGRAASGAESLAERLRRAGRASRIAAAGGGRAVAVTVPEMDGKTPGLDLLELDRAVQRDARRYDGGFSLF